MVLLLKPKPCSGFCCGALWMSRSMETVTASFTKSPCALHEEKILPIEETLHHGTLHCPGWQKQNGVLVMSNCCNSLLQCL